MAACVIEDDLKVIFKFGLGSKFISAVNCLSMIGCGNGFLKQ